MQIHSDFKALYGKSTRNYKSKDKVNNSIKTGKTNFEVVEGTPKDFLKAKNWGYMTSNPHANLGEVFPITEKKNSTFKGSNIIFVDIDGSLLYNSFQEYNQKLIDADFEATVYETSFNNLRKTWEVELAGKKKPRLDVPAEKMNDKVAKFHLFFWFDTTIEGELYYRFCVWMLNKKIFSITGEEVDDRCNLNPCQYLNGTYKKNPDLVGYTSGLTNRIYSLADINVTEEGYIDFLINRADYGRFNKETGKWGEFKKSKEKKIQKELFEVTGKIYNYNSESHKFEEGGELLTDDYADPEIIVDPEIYSEDIQELMQQWDFLKANKAAWGIESCWLNAMKKYEHIYRPNYGEWVNGVQKIQEGHFQLYWQQETLGASQGRKKILFKNMCFRRLLKPSVTREELFVNALWDIWDFIDNTVDSINAMEIMRNVELSLTKDVNWIEETFEKELALLRSKAQKRGLQYESREEISKEKTFLRFDNYFVSGMNKEEFKAALVKNGFWEISDRYYYEYKASRIKRNLDADMKDDEVKIALIDTSLSKRKSYQEFKKLGGKCGMGKFCELFDTKLSRLTNSSTSEEINEPDTLCGNQTVQEINEWGMPAFSSFTQPAAVKPAVEEVKEQVSSPFQNNFKIETPKLNLESIKVEESEKKEEVKEEGNKSPWGNFNNSIALDFMKRFQTNAI